MPFPFGFRFGRIGGSQVAGSIPRSTLLSGLVFAYDMSPNAIGKRLDLTGQENHLSETGTVTEVAGVIGTASQSAIGASQNALVNDSVPEDFLFAPDADIEINGMLKIVVNTDGSYGQALIYLREDVDSLRLVIPSTRKPIFSATMNDNGSADAAWGTALTVGTWYYFSAYVDISTGTVGLSINNATYVTAVHGDAPGTNWVGTGVETFDFLDSASSGGSPLGTYALDEVYGWNRLLTPTERTARYRGGIPLPYPFI